jgi:hypothetical protein
VQEDGGQIQGFALFVCLFVSLCVSLFGESGGCAIAIVALVTINEDQDHFHSLGYSLLPLCPKLR